MKKTLFLSLLALLGCSKNNDDKDNTDKGSYISFKRNDVGEKYEGAGSFYYRVVSIPPNDSTWGGGIQRIGENNPPYLKAGISIIKKPSKVELNVTYSPALVEINYNGIVFRDTAAFIITDTANGQVTGHVFGGNKMQGFTLGDKTKPENVFISDVYFEKLKIYQY